MKDIAGTLVVVIILISALPHKGFGFETRFSYKMTLIADKYAPVIEPHEVETETSYSDYQRYDIANKLDGICKGERGGLNLLFRVKKGVSVINFSVSKTLFGDKHEQVATEIRSKLERKYPLIESSELVTTGTYGFKLKFTHSLTSIADADMLAEIIDYMLLLYVAEYGKK